MSAGTKDYQSLKIKDLTPEDRPREKLIRFGEKHLSDAELLAILINTGNKKESVLHLAQRMLKEVNYDLNVLAKMSVGELMKIKGIGLAKAVIIKAALELSVRRNIRNNKEHKKVNDSRSAFKYFQPFFFDLQHEEFHVMLLNRSNRILDIFRHTTGGTHGTVVDVKMLAEKVIQNRASGIILAHNHPGGNLKPSEEDKKCTQRVKNALEFFDCKLLDHLIICNEEYFSFADEGLL
jgi:DNA repair protein RadC